MKKQIKKSLLLLGLAVGAAVLHNVIFGLFGIEEPVFFTLSLLLFLALVVSVFYNIICRCRSKEEKK
jgi:hypothetical protein